MEDYVLNDNYYQPHPQDLVAGETTPLRISKKYLDLAGNREPNIDWSVIPEMLDLVEKTEIPSWWKNEALGHLRDAMNEDLSDVRRMHHFDLAGSRIWEGSTTAHSFYPPKLPSLMKLFQSAGGR